MKQVFLGTGFPIKGASQTSTFCEPIFCSAGQETKETATRQKQLTMRAKDAEDGGRGRGRGRGKCKGRGRGNGGESKRSPSRPKLKATSSKEPHDEKKPRTRKTATMKRPAKSSDIQTQGHEEWEGEGCWADEWQGHWEEEWGDEWDHESWGSSGKDWDRYAWTAGQEALQQLAGGSAASSEAGESKDKEGAKKKKSKVDNNTEHGAAKKRRRLDEVKPEAKTKVKKNQAKAVKGKKPANESKSKGKGSTKKVLEAPTPVPKSKNVLVKILVDFGKQFAEVADSDAKEAVKPLLAKSSSCRLNIYWDKRSAAAVHSHRDKCDFAQFRFVYEHLSWACRMAVNSKSAELLAS